MPRPATAAAMWGARSRWRTHHRPDAGPSVRRSATDGRSRRADRSSSSSANARPRPVAFVQASLPVQRTRKAPVRAGSSSRASLAASAGVRTRPLIPSTGNVDVAASMSAPTSAPLRTAQSAAPEVRERLNEMPEPAGWARYGLPWGPVAKPRLVGAMPQILAVTREAEPVTAGQVLRREGSEAGVVRSEPPFIEGRPPDVDLIGREGDHFVRLRSGGRAGGAVAGGRCRHGRVSPTKLASRSIARASTTPTGPSKMKK